jgi:hypothetical protein
LLARCPTARQMSKANSLVMLKLLRLDAMLLCKTMNPAGRSTGTAGRRVRWRPLMKMKSTSDTLESTSLLLS